MILGLFFLYYIGKSFYELARLHQRSAWGFAILGVGSYYLGTILGALLIAVFVELVTDSSIDDIPDMALNVMSIPFGAALCWGTYRFLKKAWSKVSTVPDHDDVLDGSLRQAEQRS
jgi:hypothetical protein